MKSLRIVPFVAALTASAALAATPVLRINDSQLTDADLKLATTAVSRQMQSMQGMKAMPNFDDLVLRHSIDQLIGRTLLVQAAREAKIVADPKEVAAALEEQRKRAGGPEALAKELAGIGITEQDLERIEADSEIVRKFIETQVTPKVAVTDADAKSYFDSHPQEFQHPEQVKLRLVLIAVQPGASEKDDAAAKARAEDARKRVLAGEDFAKVAQEVSADSSKARGGEVGWVRKGVLLTELEAPVWALKTGEVSEVLKTKYGYHVFKVDERRQPGPLPFDEVKPMLVNYLKSSKSDTAVRGFIAERRAKAKIEALDPKVKAAVDALAAESKPGAAASKPGTPASKPAPAAPGASAPAAPVAAAPAAPTVAAPVAPTVAAPAPKPTADAPKKP